MTRRVFLALVYVILMIKLVTPCNKALIKTKVVAACGMHKRSMLTDDINDLIPLSKRLSNNLDYAERQYKILVENDEDVDDDDLNSDALAEGKKVEISKAASISSKRPDHLSYFNIYMDRTEKPIVHMDNDRLTFNQKRSIQNLVEECCRRPVECSEADFREICDKK
ncbi:uncharacterized protein LOC126907705 [Daktulosphaira vitifoliae]|uniref:uncharacterized protein LOC126907705 n=1 Tax=Daktulosphaira vitifoliae TaxID=58002 RepID=UPI0021A98D2D|nr:uncharacterized protein LOC126907705 [Daktulosphaira vitifoliae]